MTSKEVYTCETCRALFVCLKYFQDHRKRHAISEGQTLFPCEHCPRADHEEHESTLHKISHKNEPPHSCNVCQKGIGISEEETLGSRRSVGTETDLQVYNLSLDNPNGRFEQNLDQDQEHDHEDDDEDDDDDEEDEDEEEDDEENEDDEDDDEEDDDEEIEDEEINGQLAHHHHLHPHHHDPKNINLGGNVTNIIYVASPTNNNINNNNTINHSPQKINYIKPSRPSRSTGKGKGNRKARLTIDGDHKRKFSCCHCGKSFKTKSHLQRHILTHTGEKPYHCNRCDCKFNQSSSLRNHIIAIHTKEYPHTCDKCHKGFLMPAVLQKHLQTTECGK